MQRTKRRPPRSGNYRKPNKSKRPRQELQVEGGGDVRGAGYKDIVKENALLVAYYKSQLFIPPEEVDQFFSTLRESLPATFRITGSKRLAESIRECLQTRFLAELASVEIEGERIPPPFALPWYPDRLAWQVELTKKFVRKSPLLSKFHQFLVRENEQGNISRQEAVSMIPPLLLDVLPHHKVLDMCAAPGSKTAQLIEFLHSTDSTIPSGVVVANDADNKRCYMLVHQAKRLNSPCFLITNHDASVFPTLYHTTDDGERLPLHYDRVLCDVPCSGDGTLRKNPIIWQQWKPSTALGLHKLQLRILSRGLELLSPGGLVAYSTCSLNPVEDEAVVATALSFCKGSVELVDCTDKLPELKRIQGITSWKVMSSGGEWMSNFSEVPESSRKSISTSMFPPSTEELSNLHLTRCMRVLPHHQNTGGFFIALLRKKEWLPWQNKNKRKDCSSSTPTRTETLGNGATTADTTTTTTTITTTEATGDATTSEDGPGIPSDSADVADSTSTDMHTMCSQSTQEASMAGGEDMDTKPESGSGEAHTAVVANKTENKDEKDERPSTALLGRPGSGYKKRTGRGFKEDPFVFLEKDGDVHQAVKSHYGLVDAFPVEQLLTRTHTGKKRNIYFTSKLVKELTQRNEFTIKIINAGLKVLARCDHPKSSCKFRLCQEGVETMVPFITSYCVYVTQADLVTLLMEPNPLQTALSQPAQDTMKPLGLGPAVFKYVPGRITEPIDPESSPLQCPISLTGWLAAKSVRLYVDKNYRYHFLSVLGRDPPSDLSLATVGGQRGEREEGEGGREEVEGVGEGEVEVCNRGDVNEGSVGEMSSVGTEDMETNKGTTEEEI